MHSQVCLCMSPGATQPSPVLPEHTAGSSLCHRLAPVRIASQEACSARWNYEWNTIYTWTAFHSGQKNINEKGSLKTRSRGTKETNAHLHRSQEQLQVANSEPVLDYNWFLQKKIMSLREHKLAVNCTMLIFNFPFSCPLCPQLVETWHSRQRKYLLRWISPHP